MYLRALIFSFCLHLLLYLGLKSGSEPIYIEIDPNDLIEVEIHPAQAKQVVLQADAPELEVVDRKQTPFLSERWQRVKTETQARKTGRTENRSPRSELEIKKQVADDELETASGDLDQMVKPKSVDLSKLGGLFERTGESTSGERLLKNIEIGDFNAINTDEYTFYSFHERVNDRIRIRWVNRIENTLAEFKRRGVIERLKKGESITMIEVRLDKNGNYLNSVLLKSSGVKSWDEAAILAFQTGAPFLNPPIEMIESDGTIRLQYRFSVFWDPKYTALIR